MTEIEPWWNDSRQEVLRLLSELDLSLAGMYQLAIDLMESSPTWGGERARLSSVGHCFREILNNLPEALNDVPGVPPRGHDDGKSAKQLAAQIDAALQGAAEMPLDGGVAESLRTLTAPSTFFDAMSHFADEHREVGRRVARRDSAVVLGRIDPDDPSLIPWKAARKFVMSRTHLNVGTPTAIPSDDEVKIHISNVEASILARLGRFFGVIDSLDDILGQANRRRPDGEDSP